MGSALPESGDGAQQLEIATYIAEGLVSDAIQGNITSESRAVTQLIISALTPLIRAEDFKGVDLAAFLESADDSFLPGFLTELNWDDATAVKAYTETWFRNLPIMAVAGVGTVQAEVVEAVVTATPASSKPRLSIWDRFLGKGRRRD